MRIPSDTDRAEAIRLLLSGLAAGDDAVALRAATADLHPRNNTFPGEVFLQVAVAALDLAQPTAEHPISGEGFVERYLPECRFRGRQNRKLRFAVSAAAALRGGLEVDLLDEVTWWGTDDFWEYALFATVALIRSCAERRGLPVTAFADELLSQYAG